MSLRESLNEILPPGWSDAIDRAKDEAEVVFRDAELASDWDQWTPPKDDEEAPWIVAAAQYALAVIRAYLAVINGWVPNRYVVDAYENMVINSTTEEALDLINPYAVLGADDSIEAAHERFRVRLDPLLKKDLIKFRRVAATGRADRLARKGASPTPASTQGQTVQTGLGQHLDKARVSASSRAAAAAVRAYIRKNQMTQTRFAGNAEISTKTLQNFLRTGTVKVGTFDRILAAAGLEKGQFPNDEDRTQD